MRTIFYTASKGFLALLSGHTHGDDVTICSKYTAMKEVTVNIHMFVVLCHNKLTLRCLFMWTILLLCALRMAR